MFFYCFSSGFIEAIKEGGDTCRLIVYGTYIHTFSERSILDGHSQSGSSTFIALYIFSLIDKISCRAE